MGTTMFIGMIIFVIVLSQVFIGWHIDDKKEKLKEERAEVNKRFRNMCMDICLSHGNRIIDTVPTETLYNIYKACVGYNGFKVEDLLDAIAEKYPNLRIYVRKTKTNIRTFSYMNDNLDVPITRNCMNPLVFACRCTARAKLEMYARQRRKDELDLIKKSI